METVAVPYALFVVGVAYIAITAVIFTAAFWFISPMFTINRRRSQYFDDWNVALHVPWVFWHIGAWWFRIQELLGNYVLPAPQRVMDLATQYMKSQVRKCCSTA